MGSSPHGAFHATTAERAEDALAEARLEFFESLDIDLAETLRRYARAMRDAARSAEESGDGYGPLKYYRAEAAYFESLGAGPLPESAAGRMEVYAAATGRSTGEGCGNLLDFRGVSEESEMRRMRSLPASEVERAFGTERPTSEAIDSGWHRLWTALDRGTGLCCRYYVGSCPAGWYFLGATDD